MRELLRLIGRAKWETIKFNGQTELLTKNTAMRVLLAADDAPTLRASEAQFARDCALVEDQWIAQGISDLDRFQREVERPRKIA